MKRGATANLAEKGHRSKERFGAVRAHCKKNRMSLTSTILRINTAILRHGMTCVSDLEENRLKMVSSDSCQFDDAGAHDADSAVGGHRGHLILYLVITSL